jgi:prepilin-type N-terminal cleavage/methylation domain-containing protein
MKLKKFFQEVTGFTLIEVLATISIAGILVGIAIPRFFALLPGIRVASAARQVATDLQLARMRAISQHAPQGLTFSTATTYSFTIGPDTRDLTLLFPGTTVTVTPGNPTFTTVGGNNANATTTITLTNNGLVRTVTVNAAGKIFTQ